MKNVIKTGEWDGKEIWREENAQETINRELGENKDKVANIFINLNER